MASNKREAGYILQTTPKKKTKTGGTKFDILLQTTPEKQTKIMAFGATNYENAMEFKRMKSPVKLDSYFHQEYDSLVLAERGTITTANTIEVPFNYNDDMEASYSLGPVSAKADIKTLRDCDDTITAFTVAGKVIIGCEKPTVLPFGTVKDDIVVMDNTGWIIISVWGDMINHLVHGFHEFTCVKTRKKEGRIILTTTPNSKVSPITAFDIPPEILPDNFFVTQRVIFVNQFEDLGEPTRFHACKVCCRKLADCRDKVNIKCENCRRWMRVDDTEKRCIVPVTVKYQDSPLKLNLADDVLTEVKTITNMESDEVVVRELLKMRNFKITFKISNRFMLGIEVDNMKNITEDTMHKAVDDEIEFKRKKSPVEVPFNYKKRTKAEMNNKKKRTKIKRKKEKQ